MVTVEHLGSRSVDARLGPLLLSTALPNPEDADTILAREMSQMSVGEREEILEDIHGVARVFSEGVDFVAQRMEQMEDCLRNIPDKDAYQRARTLDPLYIHNRKFRLMFLRSEKYDPELAAQRLVRYCKEKLFLFGARNLARDITLDDLDNDDLICLERGNFSLAPGGRKDQSGRPIVIFTFPLNLPTPPISKMRAAWYFCSRVVDSDEETQLKGVVVIARSSHETMPPTPLMMRSISKLMSALPIRLSALHYCACDSTLVGLLSLPRFYLDKGALMRSRVHIGSENMCILQTFGIPPPTISCVISGDSLHRFHASWISWRKQQEMASILCEGESQIIQPGRFDVLYGRGRSRDHSGNLRIKSIVESFQVEYEAANRMEKTTITSRIVSMIHEAGGRFLKQDSENGGWVEVEDCSAREKVSKFFRKIRS